MQREILLQIDDEISTAESQLTSDYLRKTANASRPSPSYRHPPKFKKKKVSFAVEEEVIPFQVGSAVASLSAHEDPCASVPLRPFGSDIVGGHLQVREPSGAWTSHMVDSFEPNKGHTLLRDGSDSDSDDIEVHLDIAALYAQGRVRFRAFADVYGTEFPDGWEQLDLRPS